MTDSQRKPAPDVVCEFVRSLAAELSAGKVDLPAFPEIAARVRRVLADPHSSLDQVVRVVGSEPALAARLLGMSNSAALNRSGRPVTDLRTAVNRLGHNMVRSASIAFAMAQLRHANKIAALERPLFEIWRRSTHVAALAYVLARQAAPRAPDPVGRDAVIQAPVVGGPVNPDEAMLGGMLHGIGKMYVLARAAHRPELIDDGPTIDGIIKDWHASIGRAILENWEFPETMAAAIGEQDDHSREAAGPPDLRDIVAVAVVLAAHGECEAPVTGLADLPTARRLGLDAPLMPRVLADGAAEIAALGEALGP